MGVDFVLRLTVKILFFSVFVVILQSFIFYMFSYVKKFVVGFDSFPLQLANYFGILSSFFVFLNILIIGFVIKNLINYWKTL